VELTLRGRGVRITEQQRTRAAGKVQKLTRLDARADRLEIEVRSERNARLNGTKRLEGTLVLRRKTLRATASAPDVDSGLDLLVERLERQVRDYREKRKKGPLPSVNRLKSPRIAPGGGSREL
jgi:ribosome hibernation promoting factor